MNNRPVILRRDCGMCWHATYHADRVLRCGVADQPQAMAWRNSTTFDAEGFPARSARACPLYLDPVED